MLELFDYLHWLSQLAITASVLIDMLHVTVGS